VLEEEEGAARPEHAVDLGEGSRGLLHRAEDERGHDRVEALPGEWQGLGRGSEDIHVLPGAELPLEDGTHVPVGLGEDQPGDALGVERQVAAGAGPQLEHLSPGAPEQLPAPVRQTGVLGALEEAVIHPGHQPAHQGTSGRFGVKPGGACAREPPRGKMPTPIVIWPDKVLSTRTRRVAEFGAALDPLLDEMMESLRAAEGIGIAANQIGVPLAVAWVGREDGTFFEIVNPSVLEKSEPVSLEEGCLSVPHEWEQTPRFGKVRVRYQDRTGAEHELSAEGRLAHVLQHEIDHLDGTTFVEHLSQLKRGLIRKRMQKLQKDRATEHVHGDDCDHD
jgi:peptide deformylase